MLTKVQLRKRYETIETDEKYKTRIDAMYAKEKDQRLKTLERERKEYERLKKKFE